ncbi:ComF family protein [Pseudoduganella violaceinigra]|uniref:ComF family protein n=1 Tax=Pseudoduganella violaceinigra TaxID=246602 RepID=UPI00042265E8|nr:ComF family protein [Pseudoduganella violaceinigra]
MAHRLLGLLLPCNCVLCGASGPELLCPGCRAQFFAAGTARCPSCANPLPAADTAPVPCGRCQADRPAFDATVAAADYALPVDRLVLQLKFARQLALARLFAGLLAEAVLRSGAVPRPALLCPVPLGPQRLAERGFNQALEIARPLGKRLGIAVAPRLAVRVRETAAQSSMLHGARQANLARAFAIPERALVEGRHIGLVDDVMSSGRTLQELAATLKRHGAARVTNYVFARTPPNTN